MLKEYMKSIKSHKYYQTIKEYKYMGTLMLNICLAAIIIFIYDPGLLGFTEIPKPLEEYPLIASMVLVFYISFLFSVLINIKNLKRESPTIGLLVSSVILISLFDLFINHKNNKNIFGDKLNSLADMGLWGDSLSGHFAVIAASLAFLIYMSQKEELKATRAHIAEQNFDNTFFNMLNLLVQIKSAFKYKYDTAHQKISAKFNFFNNKKRDSDNLIYFEEFLYNTMNDMEFKADHNFNTQYIEQSQEQDLVLLDNYFRTLYRIYKFIDKDAPEEKKDLYSGVVRAQLSNYELLIIMLNGLTDRGKNFKPLIEKYELFDNFFEDELAREHISILLPELKKYDIKAWGENMDMKSKIQNTK